MPQEATWIDPRWSITSDLLAVGDAAREITHALFLSFPFEPLACTASFVGIGWLPERIRDGSGFEWNENREKRLQWLASAPRRIRPLVRRRIAVTPRAVIAERQLELHLAGAWSDSHGPI